MVRASCLALLAVTAAAAAGCGARPPARHADPAPARVSCLGRRVSPSPASTAGMVRLRGGVFLMGARPLRPEEGPPRPTRVTGFWIDRTDVTNADFARFVRATGYITLAERPLDPRSYPGLSGDQLKPSAIVFQLASTSTVRVA